ncbi:MAG: DUF805 domain-containing protein [Treponema sp.]|nr:DUF805 domain-containing protein [Treponema sp.]
MAQCSHCGTRIEDEALICPYCKTVVTSPLSNPVNPFAPPKQASQAQGKEPSPWQYFIGCFKKYAVFKGRARRAEFWWFTFFDILVTSVITFLDGILGTPTISDFGLLQGIWFLLSITPTISVTVRRMHDCDKPGGFMWIPIYGWLILPLTRGTEGENNYGPDPMENLTS